MKFPHCVSLLIDHVPIFNGFLTPPIMMFGLGRPFSYSMAAADELKKGSSNELRQKKAFGGFSIGSKTAKKDMTEKTNNQIENEIVLPPS